MLWRTSTASCRWDVYDMCFVGCCGAFRKCLLVLCGSNAVGCCVWCVWCAAGLAGLCLVRYMLRAEQASLIGESQAVLKGTDAIADPD